MADFYGLPNWESRDAHLSVFSDWQFNSKDVEGIKKEIKSYLEERYDGIEDRWIASIFWRYVQRIDTQKLAEIYATENSEDAED